MIGEYLLDIKGVIDKVSLSATTIREMVREGEFPQPLTVRNMPRWRGADVDAWIVEQAGQSRTVQPRKEGGRFAKSSGRESFTRATG